MPPDDLADVPLEDDDVRFESAGAVVLWLRDVFLRPESPLHIPEHAHLRDALILVLWTNAESRRQGRAVLGTAEMPQFQGDRWKQARQRLQLREWLGGVEPDFVITLSAPACAAMDDASFCALLDHELSHCAQATDEFGEPKFRKDGRPAFAIRGHDVEQFVGVVERWGTDAAGVRRLVAAAARAPRFGAATIAGVCGTCPAPTGGR